MRPLLALLLLLVLAAPARAAGPEVGIADDRILLAGGPDADAAVAEWKNLGIEQVRIYALWSRIAGPSPSAPDDWAQLDHAVNRVVDAGMKPLLTVTGPGPLWSSRRAERGDARWDPDPAAFADFAGAVAARYGDRVDRYVIWNEPNLGSWLRPQAACFGKVCTAVSPHLYRGLVRAAYPAIHAADPRATVLIGAMSSRGTDMRGENSTIRPMAFLRALGCVDTAFRKVRSGRCKGFQPAKGDGFAFHPHGVLTAPDKAFLNPDDVSLASLPRLERVLDRIQRGGGLKASTSRFGLYIDEYGYQTNPPDRLVGVSATQQSTWLQRAAYEAWRDPRVKLFTQYLWRDEPRHNGGYGGWQSGLRFADGSAKPSYSHFDTPFELDSARNRLWGQVRPGGRHTVTIQQRPHNSGGWSTLTTVQTDARGYFSIVRHLRPGTAYRFRGAGATSSTLRR
jgi:hypothetical protein